MDLSLFLPPLVACLIIVAIHSYLGLHVLAREVIFVDLSLAQMAALGSAVAVLVGTAPDSPRGFLYLPGLYHHRCSALRRDAKQRQGPGAARGHHRHRVRRGVSRGNPGGRSYGAGRGSDQGHPGGQPALGHLADDHPARRRVRAIGVFHWVLRRRFLTISFKPEVAVTEGWNLKLWDFWFYLSFGVVITFSVPIVGVLLVFSFLVVPAAIAFQFTQRLGMLAVLAWIAGVVASATGLWISFRFDQPTGPVIVCVFGLLLLVVSVVRRMAVKGSGLRVEG